MGLLDCSRVFFESSLWCFQVSWAVYPLLQMCQQVLDERLMLPLPISPIISQHTPTSSNSICPCDDDSTRSIHSMKCVVLVFTDPHGLIWPMTANMQKWFTIFKYVDTRLSVPCSSTVAGGLCIIAIMISRVCDQTSVKHQFNYMYYRCDISNKSSR